MGLNGVGSLPNDIRTYYSRITLVEVEFYKNSFAII